MSEELANFLDRLREFGESKSIFKGEFKELLEGADLVEKEITDLENQLKIASCKSY